MFLDFDVIVIGAGHAGLEASFIASKFNLKVAIFTLNKDSVANLPCNPSIGGPAKGVVVREIDALGGIQAIAADANKIQIKKVNYSKGPGVWAFRAQIDKLTYHEWFLKKINNNSNLTLICEEIIELLIENGKVVGAKTKNKIYKAKTVIVTTGTYLKSELYHDKKFADLGPDKNPSSNYLSVFFQKYNIELLRLKTGTSPRVYKNSIDFSQLTKDMDNDDTISFSFFEGTTLPLKDQMFCYLTETTKSTKDFINTNKCNFGIFNGAINASGPRYCPSIEDKFFRFPHREKHFIFVEPVSRNLDFYYLSGLSTSLSKEKQLDLLRTIKGFENAKIKKFAYSIVYDAINPVQLNKTLELKKISNLYFAGQVNGSSGYEEAAAQGLIAGINAALKIKNLSPFILRRDEAYIGVLIDDLTSKGVQEPYRLLTSRAEFRLLLRNDNADERLIKHGYKLGIVSKNNYQKFKNENKKINENIKFLKNNYASKYKLVQGDDGPLTLFSWLCRNNSSYEKLEKAVGLKLHVLETKAKEKLLIKVKYDGYIKLQEQKIKKLDKWQKISLLNILNYENIQNLSSEAIEKLNKRKPINIHDAMKISGININDIFWIKNYLDKNKLTI